jgi:transmembrane sensor
MTWLGYHQQSEQFASTAHESLGRGDQAKARESFSKAAELEEQALAVLIPADKPRTFSITAVSAAALWFKASEFAKARAVAEKALSDSSLAPFATEQLRELLAQIAPPHDEPTPARQQVPADRPRYVRWAIAAIALFGLLSAGYYFMHARGWLDERYVTMTGEMRTVKLGDGSVVYLNTRTILRRPAGAGHRQLKMVVGEALFDVTSSPAHPFSVELEDSEISVHGTRFNVYRKPNSDTTISVLQGIVEVRGFGRSRDVPQWTRTVLAGQEIEYRSASLVREPYMTDTEAAVQWRAGRLAVTGATIEEIVQELARYTDQKIIVRDAQVASTRVSVVLNTRDVHDALRRLSELAPLDVQDGSGTITIDHAGANPQ